MVNKQGKTSLHFPAEDVLTEPDDIEASSRIKDTLQIHMIKLFFGDHNVPYLQFLNMSIDEKPSRNFMGKEPVAIKKLLLMITIVVHALETMKH